MILNRKLGIIHLKIVYCGPALSGKTTNLEVIHAYTMPEMRSEMMSLKTGEDRTLFFDFLQLEFGEIYGLRPKFGIYTVPGQVCYASTRKATLRGVDGVVFVADSQAERLGDNLRQIRELEQTLATMGQQLSDFPFVLQCNKLDLPNSMHPRQLHAEIGHLDAPYFPSVATHGVGVADTLEAILKRTLNVLHQPA